MIKIYPEAVSDVAATTKNKLYEALECLVENDIEACKSLIKMCIAKMETVGEIFDLAVSEQDRHPGQTAQGAGRNR